jgi:hypothetical protein
MVYDYDSFNHIFSIHLVYITISTDMFARLILTCGHVMASLMTLCALCLGVCAVLFIYLFDIFPSVPCGF